MPVQSKDADNDTKTWNWPTLCLIFMIVCFVTMGVHNTCVFFSLLCWSWLKWGSFSIKKDNNPLFTLTRPWKAKLRRCWSSTFSQTLYFVYESKQKIGNINSFFTVYSIYLSPTCRYQCVGGRGGREMVSSSDSTENMHTCITYTPLVGLFSFQTQEEIDNVLLTWERQNLRMFYILIYTNN